MVTIYGLIDPRTNEVRYIGKTNQKLQNRLMAHLRDVGICHRVNWIKELNQLGLKPKIREIEKIQSWRNWQQAEIFWIKTAKQFGLNLTNNTSGGDGVPDLPPETRERMRKTWLGRKHKPETIEKLKLCRPNFRHSKESKLKIGRAHKGRKITWIKKIAKSLRKLNQKSVALVKCRLDAGEKVQSLATELKMHRTSISKIKSGTYFLPYRRKK